MCPVHRHILTQADQQLMRNKFQLIVAHHLYRAFVLGQGIIEGNLFIRQTGLFATLARRAYILGKLDQFLQHLGSGDGVGVVACYGMFQSF